MGLATRAIRLVYWNEVLAGLVPALFPFGSCHGRFRRRIPRELSPFPRRQNPLCGNLVLDSHPMACPVSSKRCPHEVLLVARGDGILVLVLPMARPRMLVDVLLPEIPKRLVMASVLGGVVVVAFRVVAVVRAVVVVSQILEWVPVRKKGLVPRKLEKRPPSFCL